MLLESLNIPLRRAINILNKFTIKLINVRGFFSLLTLKWSRGGSYGPNI